MEMYWPEGREPLGVVQVEVLLHKGPHRNPLRAAAEGLLKERRAVARLVRGEGGGLAVGPAAAQKREWHMWNVPCMMIGGTGADWRGVGTETAALAAFGLRK